MGEVLKVLSERNFAGNQVTIEVNKSHKKTQQNSIHIQTDKFRIEMPEDDFFDITLQTLKAIKRIKDLKNIKE